MERCCCLTPSTADGCTCWFKVTVDLSVQVLVLSCAACELWAVVPPARGSAPRWPVLLLSWLGEVASTTRLCCVHSAALSRDSGDLSEPLKGISGVRREGEEVRMS